MLGSVVVVDVVGGTVVVVLGDVVVEPRGGVVCGEVEHDARVSAAQHAASAMAGRRALMTVTFSQVRDF
ncbi:MAG TPA: hypothetical protein VL961_10495 [Acidimicrobiales bacterium]|nr:hypothetical protein [Acidimicrobiales bacterium]